MLCLTGRKLMLHTLSSLIGAFISDFYSLATQKEYVLIRVNSNKRIRLVEINADGMNALRIRYF